MYKRKCEKPWNVMKHETQRILVSKNVLEMQSFCNGLTHNPDWGSVLCFLKISTMSLTIHEP